MLKGAVGITQTEQCNASAQPGGAVSVQWLSVSLT